MSKNINAQISEKKNVNDVIFVILIGFFVFILSGLHSIGPAYLQDEIGYLSKAALLAGKLVDGSSSYHGGISILIAPLFLFDEPSKIWTGILVVNASVCAATFFTLLKIADSYALNVDPWVVRGAVLLALIYPATWVMAGYIFPSIYLGFFYLLVVWIILRGSEHIGWNIFLAMLVGFIYWVHPTGLVVCVAFVLARIVLYCKERNKSMWKLLFLQLMIVGLMVVFYKFWIHPCMNMLMTPDGQSIRSHYGSFSQQIEKLLSLTGLQGVFTAALGQLSYLVISTFGLGFFGLVYLFVNSCEFILSKGASRENKVNIFVLLSVLGLLTMGAVAMAIPIRIDHIVYGRYQEYTYTLLIFLGFIYYVKESRGGCFSFSLKISTVIMVFIIAMKAWLIYPSLDGVDGNNNIINTIGMYPQYIFEGSDLVLWLFAGLCGVLFLLFVGPWFYIPAMIIMSIVAIFNQVAWHKSILAGHSKPSALAFLVAEDLKPRGCVAFDIEGMDGERLSLRQKEQFNIFKFYFSNYQYKRMSFASWFNDCDGPLLTYSPEKYIGNKNIIVRARDSDLGLFLISRSLDFNWVGDNIPGLIFNKENNPTCFVGGCFEMLPSQLLKFSQNGMMRDGYLVENVDKTGGYIFFGPYSMLGDGAWRVNLELERFTEGEYVLDVVSGGGKVKHAERNINPSDFSNGVISLSFDLIEKVNTLEIRLRVTKAGNISVKKYTITSR